MSCKHLKPNCMLYQPTLNWWGMLNISVAAFLLALLFFIISTSPSSAEFSFLQLICPAGWAGRSQATVVLLAQEQALPAILWAVPCSAWGSREAAEVTVGLKPHCHCQGGKWWLWRNRRVNLLPAPSRAAVGSLGSHWGQHWAASSPRAPVLAPVLQGFLHLLSGYCFGRV